MITKVEDMPLVEGNMTYSDNTLPFNMKMREVCCAICKYRTMTNLVNPKCVDCNNALVNVVRPQL